jgi:hypothetical protein
VTATVQTALEAIAAVASSHPPECICVTCRAAAGDDDALLEVLAAVNDVGSWLDGLAYCNRTATETEACG